MSSCTDQMIEPEIIPTRSIRDLTYKDVPNVVSQLQEGLGLRGGNDRLSVNDEGRTYGVIIDWNRITELIDTVGNVNYTFAVVDEDEDPYTFHNLIIGKNEEGYWKRPYLLTYVMGEEFRSKYDATGSTEGFTGRLLKRYISPSTSDSRRGVVNNYEDPYTSNDPCDRETEVISVGSGGGDDPYTEFEAPTPGMGNTFCYTYWYYFETSTICGNDGYFTDCEMGVRRPFLVTECIEYGGSMAGSDPCDQDKEEVAIIDPEANELDCSTFENRVENILKSEGGFVNNPDDKGGATNRGIAWNTWKENALKILGKEPTLDNLKNLSEADAKKIYKAKYWSKSGGENINDGDTRYFMFDFYVNAGGNAIKILQKTLNEHFGNSLTIDGGMGPNTLNAINAANPMMLYNQLKMDRISYYERIAAKDKSQEQFLDGWKDRVNKFKDKTLQNKKNVNC